MFLTIIVTLYTLNSKFSPLRFPFFVLFSTLKYKSGQNRAFLVFSSLKIGRSFAPILGPFPWSFSLIFQTVTPHNITDGKFYCQNHKKFPEAPEKISRGSRKNFSGFHEKFWPVSRNHFACHFKVIWPVPRFAFVPKWTKSQAGENWVKRAKED